MNEPTVVWVVWQRGEEVQLYDEETSFDRQEGVDSAQVSVRIHVRTLHSIHAREESARCIAAGPSNGKRFTVERREVQS